jgi:cysteine desulfurase/selenocysteine lyase
MQFYGVSATVRMSLSFYNTTEEIDRMVAALRHVKEMFA